MDIDAFNGSAAEELTETLTACADIPAWVAAIVDGRPYADTDALLRTAEGATAFWTADDVERALAQHPRIGERSDRGGAEAAMSAREQSGVSQEADVAERLRAGNAAYEERFDRVYLVRAAGRSAEEILAMLEQRLTNDPQTELEVTAGQLREIAMLRLRGLLDLPADPPATRMDP
ncbi:2-oxo-4-hydroxy-4-carboxy-5-ureidoimidazoline decarboxylase [Mumia flava]|uniref:2-oxo-4-hydroxy-4-carboxy-5-ureidoimidazoline decarboxylase n=1 Tax=Mumia flava TaxID=1348852 RepID=A0A2M9BJT8_9ACTN|nr:2-oxo-4-hydroxy-4-carboxy-5-ureidoimidazoline decarboxylase [Mumia flava]PJJ58220.1 2-oxo-4-hydroxy-4-carboxy-5-ureidoimidazoline decarboxylase [Mumia flava]